MSPALRDLTGKELANEVQAALMAVIDGEAPVGDLDVYRSQLLELGFYVAEVARRFRDGLEGGREVGVDSAPVHNHASEFSRPELHTYALATRPEFRESMPALTDLLELLSDPGATSWSCACWFRSNPGVIEEARHLLGR